MKKSVTYNIVSLKEHFDCKLRSIKKTAKLAARLLEQRQEFIDKELNHIKSDVRVLLDSKATIEGKASQKSVNLAQVLSLVALLIALLSLVIELLK